LPKTNGNFILIYSCMFHQIYFRIELDNFNCIKFHCAGYYLSLVHMGRAYQAIIFNEFAKYFVIMPNS
jgi:hypothetical protein